MSERILLMFAVNGRQGEPTGHIQGLELMIGDDSAADLASGIWPPSACPRFSHPDAGAVRISRRKFPVSNYTTWVGNWCWDSAVVTAPVAADLLNYLRSLKWHNEGGMCAIGDMWDSGQKFRASDIAALAMTAEELAERKRKRTEGSELL